MSSMKVSMRLLELGGSGFGVLGSLVEFSSSIAISVSLCVYVTVL